MIRNHPLLKEFEENQQRKPSLGYLKQLEIFEALYQEAKNLGIFPLKNPLDGIEVDIRLAQALNVRKPA